MNGRAGMIVFVLILATLLTGALLAVDVFTRPVIARNEELTIKKSVMEALAIPYADDSLEAAFADEIQTVEQGGRKFYVTRGKAVAFQFRGSGLWGPIRGVLAVEPDGTTVKGITIVHQEETPGLGSRIADAEYLTAFRAKRLLPRLVVTKQGEASAPDEIDGITGATLSCQAFARLLNNEAAVCLPLIKEIQK